MRRRRRLQRAVALAAFALLCFAAAIPLAAPPARAPRVEAARTTLARWGPTGRLPVQASVLWPGVCGPGEHRSDETQLALSAAGLDDCPSF